MTNSVRYKVYGFDGFELDTATKLLYRGGEQVVLTPKAVETLIALVETKGSVVTKDELMQKIWGDTVVEESNLAQYLHVLRKTLGTTSAGVPFIETLKRRGYRFNGSVTVVRDGNGIHAVNGDTVHSLGPSDIKARSFNRISGNQEQRGNLRAFGAQAVAAREPEDRSVVERADNVYSVSDWRRASRADAPRQAAPPARGYRWPSALILMALVATSGGLGVGIYRLAGDGQNVQTRSVPFRGSGMTRLTTAGVSKRSAVSPDGMYVAHVIGSSEGDSLWVRQVAVANDMRTAGPSQSDFVWVTFSSDSNFVYYLALEKDKGEPELFRVPVMGGPIVKILNDIAPPAFSPDGSRMAFMKTNQGESQLFVANSDGTNQELIFTRREPNYLNMFWNAPAWSLDGRSLAVPVNQSDQNGRYETVLAIDVETRTERRLTEARWQQVGQSRWMSDGLIVTASETSTGPNQLWHISLPDGAASRITRDLNSYQNLSLTSDASLLAVTQRHVVSNIWTLGGRGSTGRKTIAVRGGLAKRTDLAAGRPPSLHF